MLHLSKGFSDDGADHEVPSLRRHEYRATFQGAGRKDLGKWRLLQHRSENRRASQWEKTTALRLLLARDPLSGSSRPRTAKSAGLSPLVATQRGLATFPYYGRCLPGSRPEPEPRSGPRAHCGASLRIAGQCRGGQARAMEERALELETAKRYRKLAGELRSVALKSHYLSTRDALLGIASEYDILAERLEALQPTRRWAF